MQPEPAAIRGETSTKGSWWRWLLVLPGAVGAYMAVSLGLALCAALFPSEAWTEALPLEWLAPFWRVVIAGLSSSAFVVAGSAVAPRKSFSIAISLAILQVAWYGRSLTSHVTEGKPVLHLSIEAAAAIGAIIAACFYVHERERQRKTG